LVLIEDQRERGPTIGPWGLSIKEVFLVKYKALGSKKWEWEQEVQFSKIFGSIFI
jgi:hypothetical protein